MSEFTKDNGQDETKGRQEDDYDEEESGINGADTQGILTQDAIDQNKLEYYQNMASLGPDSDDEGFPQTNNATDVETNSDDEQAGNSYEPLAEEFGDFVSSSNVAPNSTESTVDGNFADFINPTGIFRKNGMDGPEVKEDDNIEESTMNSNTDVTPNVSIPPLTQDKIDTIKKAMSKITIKSPTLGSSSVADMILSSKLRIGDEISTQSASSSS